MACASTVYSLAKKCSQLGPLVNSPFKQLHKAKEKLDEHFRQGGKGNKAHNDAVSDAMSFISVMANRRDPINRQLNETVAISVAQNRMILESIVKTAIFCARQNAPCVAIVMMQYF